MAARLLLLLASIRIPGAAIDSCLTSLSWPEKQTSHQNSLSAANMSRRSTPVYRWFFGIYYLFICFLLLLYFNEHFKHLLAITVCLSRALRQRFWGAEIGLFMSYEKTLKQLMHLSGDVS